MTNNNKDIEKEILSNLKIIKGEELLKEMENIIKEELNEKEKNKKFK